MGKAYSEEQRMRVKCMLEAGRDEESIEKETGVSDRTIRRWKLELEKTGRIGKPAESRTGRHRVLNAEVEAALFEHVKGKTDMSVDDMLWWLYDTYKIVVGTRTIRRVFERKGEKAKVKMIKGKTSAPPANNDGANGGAKADDDDDDDDGDEDEEQHVQYQSPYAPMQTAQSAEQQLAQAVQQHHTPQTPYAPQVSMDGDLPEDEETIQLQLQQIALQKREVELKLKMRRLQAGKGTPGTTQKGTPSSLFNPAAAIAGPDLPKRDSRSKKKIEESKKRTAERQERMLRDLERRSRRRDHLTAEWVASKDIWPLRAQGLLADLMHQYGCYAHTNNNVDTFEHMYSDLYSLVDLSKGDWVPQLHDEMLRERMKRKMGQLRTKMQKTGEIVGPGDAYGGFQRAENYTGVAAGEADAGDESELVGDNAGHGQAGAQQHHQQLQSQQQQDPNELQYDPAIQDAHNEQAQALQQHAQAAAQGLQSMQQYSPYPQHQAIGHQSHQPPSQYPSMPQSHHQGMLPYNMDGQQSMQAQDGGMVM